MYVCIHDLSPAGAKRTSGGLQSRRLQRLRRRTHPVPHLAEVVAGKVGRSFDRAVISSRLGAGACPTAANVAVVERVLPFGEQQRVGEDLSNKPWCARCHINDGRLEAYGYRGTRISDCPHRHTATLYNYITISPRLGGSRGQHCRAPDQPTPVEAVV